MEDKFKSKFKVKGKEYNLTYKDEIELGDIFCINLNDLAAWGASWDDSTIDMVHNKNRYYKEEDSFFADNPLCPNINMLAIVKYIGNGVIEEMLTHEQIMLESGTDLSDEARKKCADTDFSNNYFVYRNWKTYEHIGENVSFSEWTNNLLSIKNLINEKLLTKSPLCFANEQGFYEIDDEAKRAYLEYSKEEIIAKITELKEKALILGERALEQIDEAYRYNSSQDMDVAYLDNEIYDFEHKSIK